MTAPTDALSPLGRAALTYASEYGWRVFPCRGKAPLTANGFHDATSDAEAIADAWTAHPDAGIGLAPGLSGLLVIDVDGPEGEARARELGCYSEPTLAARTRRGEHLYFVHPGGAIGNRKLHPEIDVRGDAGYVILPPSPHPEGGRYEWLTEGVKPGALPPLVLAAILNGKGTGKPAPAGALPERIAVGQRNATLASLAGSMRRRGASPAAIAAALEEENALRCDPPLAGAELESIAASVGRYAPAPVATDEALPSPTEMSPSDTDTGNATRLVTLHGARLHYIALWGKWLVWTPVEGRWELDHHDVQVRELAKDVGRAVKAAAAVELDGDRAKKLFAFALKSLDSHGIGGMVDLARGIAGIRLEHEALDRDGWSLGVRNGVIDLRTGTVRPANPADLMMMQAPVNCDASAVAPRWRRALEEWFPDAEVRAYVQRVAGAALVGAQPDHVFIILYGGGRNGKGTFIRALQRVLGPYAGVIHLSLLVDQKYEHHDTVKAALFRTRLAVASETQRRVKLDEASVKNLTGGDRITARRMREDPWEFDPTHSLWLQTNHLPEISGRDVGIWSRIRVVKWEATFSEQQQDRTLDATLAGEAPGILAWLLQGCLAWQCEGLAEPEAVVRETLAYRQAEDVFSRFAVDTGLTFAPTASIPAGTIQEMLAAWAHGEGLDPSRSDLSAWLKDHNAKPRRSWETGSDAKRRQVRFWSGVGIGAEHETDEGDLLL